MYGVVQLKERYFVISGLISDREADLDLRSIEEEFVREYRGKIIGNRIQIMYEIDLSVVQTLEVYRLIKDSIE